MDASTIRTSSTAPKPKPKPKVKEKVASLDEVDPEIRAMSPLPLAQ